MDRICIIYLLLCMIPESGVKFSSGVMILVMILEWIVFEWEMYNKNTSTNEEKEKEESNDKV